MSQDASNLVLVLTARTPHIACSACKAWAAACILVVFSMADAGHLNDVSVGHGAVCSCREGMDS